MKRSKRLAQLAAVVFVLSGKPTFAGDVSQKSDPARNKGKGAQFAGGTRVAFGGELLVTLSAPVGPPPAPLGSMACGELADQWAVQCQAGTEHPVPPNLTCEDQRRAYYDQCVATGIFPPHDTIIGGGSNDTILGGTGNDVI